MINKNIIVGFGVLLSLVASKKEVLDLKAFTLNAPINWNYIPARGIDSFIGYISIGNHDTLHFDYGYYSWQLDEDLNYYTSNDSVYFSELNDEKSDYIYKFKILKKDFIKEEFYKQQYYFETINGERIKITIPKKSADGVTGAYFEKTGTKSKAKLSIYGQNLTPQNQKIFLEVIKTIKFK